LSSSAHATPLGIDVFESRDKATTEGDAVLAADPDTAYAVATDYENWTRIFPTVRSAVVKERTHDRAEVTFVHTDGSVDHLRFRNRPATRTVAFEQLEGDADVSAEIAFTPGDLAGTTRVHTRLHVDVHGIASAFVSDSELRTLRQQHVRDDLGRLQAYFANRRRP
jgi:uncharacterized membrane protein